MPVCLHVTVCLFVCVAVSHDCMSPAKKRLKRSRCRLLGAVSKGTGLDMLGGRYTQSDSQGAASGDAAYSPRLMWPLDVNISIVLTRS